MGDLNINFTQLIIMSNWRYCNIMFLPTNTVISIILIYTYLGIVTALVMLFAGVTVTVLVFVIVAYHRHKLRHQRNQETPQCSQYHASVHLFGITTVILLYSCCLRGAV